MSRPRLLIGLTGGIASGKSAAAELLRDRGAVIVDADLLAREVVAPGTEGLALVRQRFGTGVVTEDGSLDRPALGRIVFADPAARAELEAIVHPRVRGRAAELTAAAGPEAVVVQVIPLLVETGQQQAFDHVLVVDVDPAVQRERLENRDGPEAAVRVSAQAAREDRLAAADTVLDNSGPPERLAAQIDDWWRRVVEHGADG